MEKLIESHKKEYKVKPDVIATAPARFHLMGEYSTFFRDKTLSMAVNLPVYVGVSKRSDQVLNFNFIQLDDKKKSSLNSLKFKKEDKWANSIKSILFAFNSMGYKLTGMDFTISSQILPSSGLGITTAIKISAAWAIKELCSLKCKISDLLLVLEKANRVYFGIENHREDNYAAIYSKENSLILTDHNKAEYETVPYKFKSHVVVLTDTKVPRVVTWNEERLFQPENILLLGELKERKANVYGGWQYEENRSEINEVLSVVSEDTKRRLLCVMYEHKNILNAVNAIEKNHFSDFAKAVKKSHEILRDLYDVSCPETDWILKRVQELDANPDDLRNIVNCGRITGKGSGRCIYSILRTEDLPKYKEKLEEYERIFGFTPEYYEVKPARGVHLV